MAVWVIAIIKHQLDAKALFRLPETLTQDKLLQSLEFELEDPAIQSYLLNNPPKKRKWYYDNPSTCADGFDLLNLLQDEDPPSIDGGINYIYATPTQCRLYSAKRITTYSRFPEMAAKLELVIGRLHSIVNPNESNPRVIYIPDGTYPESIAWDEDQRPFDNLVDWMEAKFGPPATSFRELNLGTKNYIVKDIIRN